MACCDDVLMAKMQKWTAQLTSLGSVTVLLVISGISIIIWMAITGFADVTGIIVGIIFIVLSMLQVLFGLVWWRAIHRQSKLYEVQQGEEDVKVEQLRLCQQAPANGKLAPSSHNGSGDAAAATSDTALMTDEVKLAYTDGAQKVSVEVVSV